MMVVEGCGVCASQVSRCPGNSDQMSRGEILGVEQTSRWWGSWSPTSVRVSLGSFVPDS